MVLITPPHVHSGCCHVHETPAERLAQAEKLCAARGGKLTGQRRMVLEALLDSGRAVGAYDLIEMVTERAGKRVAPITIYRALDFLVENDLAHRIESRNAFLACPGGHGAHPQAMFMICEACGRVGEAMSPALESELARLAGVNGFSPRGRVIELTGLCGQCAAVGKNEVPGKSP